MTPFARRVAGLVSLLLIGCLVWWSTTGDPSDDAPASSAIATSSATTQAPGMPSLQDFTISIGDLPPEAIDVIAAIEAGGPYAYAKDGSVFGNREKLLPPFKHGYYREYTVPTPGSEDRGARRIVVGGGGEVFYSADHYQSFHLVRAVQ